MQKQTNGSDCALFAIAFAKRRCQKTKKMQAIEVYCYCRLAAKEGERMVMCDGCHEWYHEQCEVVPVAAWTNPDSKWHCGLCKCVV